MLSAQGSVAASAASYNNHWGVPLSLARMPRDTAFGVFEIGMNHAGEIRNLVHHVRPHVAVITTIAPAHIEFFGSLEAIADAKAEILEGIEPGGACLLPADNEQFVATEAPRRRAVDSGRLPFGIGCKLMRRLLSAHAVGDAAKMLSQAYLAAASNFALARPGGTLR